MDPDHQLASLARDLEVQRIRSGVEPAEDRRAIGRTCARIDRVRDARELVIAQGAPSIVGHAHNIDSSPLDFDLTSEQQSIRKLAKDFAEKEIATGARVRGRNETCP